MDLNKISVVPRIRGGWEAIDLGFTMARRWYLPLFFSWTAPSLLCFLLLSLLFSNSYWIAITLTWWLKPIWDRGPLFIVSRRLFGENLTALDYFKNFFSVQKKSWLAWITWRRFSPTRTYNLPVNMLEGLSGEQYGKRINVLHRKKSSEAMWALITCVHIELILATGIIALAFIMIPPEMKLDIFDSTTDYFGPATLIFNALSYVAMCLVATVLCLLGVFFCILTGA